MLTLTEISAPRSFSFPQKVNRSSSEGAMHEILSRQPLSKYQELSLVALGWSLSAALVLLYTFCWLAVFIAPGLAHGWLALLSIEPPGSATNLLAGIIWSINLGWRAAAVLATLQSAILRR